MFELDAAVVVNCFKSLPSLSNIDPFILDYKELYAKMTSVSICSISRFCNEAAHKLAQTAKTYGTRTWVGYAPNLMVWSNFYAVVS
jgi:hypothetical protein